MLPLAKLTALRHTLHASPEVSGLEQQTAALIEAYLRGLEPDSLVTGLGGHGILATFEGGLEGPTLLFRSELDALPIPEANTFAHRSKHPGVSHKCGHDGHSAALCGLAELLARSRPPRGRVHLLFQPAEEVGEGAKAVLADPKFAPFRPDLAFALHNFPGFPAGSVVLRDRTITAAVVGLAVRLEGRTAHAAQPELGRNPAFAVAELLQYSQTLNRPDPTLPEFRLTTPVGVRVGSPAYGVAAGDGELNLTLRSWTDDGLEELAASLLLRARQLAERDGLTLSHQTTEHFAANFNDPAAAAAARRAAVSCGLEVLELPVALKGGEDFGLFSARFPCCLILLGAGEATPPLHSPDYDFPDELLEPAVRLMAQIVREALG